MDEAVEQLLKFGTLVYAVSIVIVTFFIRRTLETKWPDLRKKADENAPAITYSSSVARWYQQVFLYAIPVVVGMSMGLLDVPFFPETITTMSGRICFGAVVGWLSSAVYKVVKKTLAKRGIDLPSPSLTPSPVPPPPEGQ